MCDRAPQNQGAAAATKNINQEAKVPGGMGAATVCAQAACSRKLTGESRSEPELGAQFLRIATERTARAATAPRRPIFAP